jgi:hypothetical protein
VSDGAVCVCAPSARRASNDDVFAPAQGVYPYAWFFCATAAGACARVRAVRAFARGAGRQKNAEFVRLLSPDATRVCARARARVPCHADADAARIAITYAGAFFAGVQARRASHAHARTHARAAALFWAVGTC